MKLFKKLIREIKQAPLQFIALMLVIAIGAFFYSGLSTYSSKQRAYVQHYFQAHNLSDLTVLYNDISMDDIANLSKLEGISKIEARKTFEATQLFQDDKASLHIHSLPQENTINTPTVTQGKLPTTSNEILLDSHYAKEHQFKVGDKFSLTINKNVKYPEKTVNFTISGLGENVEYVKKNATQNHKNEGFGYVTETTIMNTFNTLSHNEILLKVKQDFDIDGVGKRIEAFSKANTLSYVDQVSKQRSFGYTQITQTIYNNGMMSKVIPLVLFLISAIILFLTMSRTIDSQRNQIGVMKALGIKDSKIMFHYMGYPLLVSMFGSILGCVLSSIVFIPMVTASSSKSYALPGITYALSWFSVVPPMIIASIFGIISVYLSGKSILRECAAQAMRPKPPKKMKKLLIEKLTRLWKSLSYSNKLILRNIFLNKQKAVASSIGVLVSTTLLITALGTQASMLKIANQINEVYTYDLKVDYKPGINPDSLSLPAGIGSRYSFSNLPIELQTENNRENATLIVTPKENKLIFWENIILTTFAIMIAIPIGGKFYALVVNALASTHQQIPDSLNMIIITIAIAAAYVLTILSSLVLRKKVKNINMIESLKSLE